MRQSLIRCLLSSRFLTSMKLRAEKRERKKRKRMKVSGKSVFKLLEIKLKKACTTRTI